MTPHRSLLALSLGALLAVGPVVHAAPEDAAAAAVTVAPAGPAVPAAGPTTAPSAAAASPDAPTDTGGRMLAPAAGQPVDVPRQVPTRTRVGGPRIDLGPTFESLSGGIALRPPLGLRPVRELSKNEIVQFVPEVKDKETPIEDAKRWVLVVTRRSFPQAQALTSYVDDKGERQNGLVQNMRENFLKEYPGAKVLRDGDPTNLGNHDCGVIIFRYTKNAERRLAQHAVIQANDQLFYLLSLNTPARDQDPPGGDEGVEDAGERVAVDTFQAVLDSVVLLDRTKIYDDQVKRLISTRSLFANLTERKLAGALIPEQWMRIKKDGREVGYSYIVEDPDRKAGRDGLRVGVRTRYMDGGKAKPFPRMDSASSMYISMDRRQEDWSTVTAYDDGTPKTAENPWKKMTEFGWSDLKTSRHAVVRRDPETGQLLDRNQEYNKGELGDPNQPWVNVRDTYNLNVQFVGSKGDLTPVNRPLPPFYLPQALGAMLPRLLPPGEQKGYLVATYVGEAREVMLRYLDVLPEKLVSLDGRTFRAVPITDRLGQEGSVTTHYVTYDGQYLGSENKDTKLVIVPTDDRTLMSLWADANLTRPPEVIEKGGEDGEGRVTPTPPTERTPSERTPSPRGRRPAAQPGQ